MDPISMAVASALIGAMATDGWEKARDGVVDLWKRLRPERARTVGQELEALHSQVLDARRSDASGVEQALEGVWGLQLDALVRTSPEAAAELRRLLDERLAPLLPPAERAQAYSVIQNATVHGGTNLQVGRDWHGQTPPPKA
ncbi:hypothetical protein RB200_29595 [Streptomyces sp. PmtG]